MPSPYSGSLHARFDTYILYQVRSSEKVSVKPQGAHRLESPL